MYDNDVYEDFTFLKGDVLCSIQDKAIIPNIWILLDSQPNVFSNG